MLNSLSGRFLILTILFVMLAEILILVPSIARYRESYLMDHLERAQIASLALLAGDMLESDLEAELLENAEVFNVVLRRDEMRQLVLSSPMPRQIAQTFDLRDRTPLSMIHDAALRLFKTDSEVIRVIGAPLRDAGLLIEITMDAVPLRQAMLDYGARILILSAMISIFAAILLFFAVQAIIVKPIRSVVDHMQRYAQAPEDGRRIITPSARVIELREAEEALKFMQTELTSALRQKDRLAQLGTAVSKISHDLRNILTSAQLFTDRIEMSEDPTVARLAPKLVNSITRAVHLCESTLAFGKAEEPSPTLSQVSLAPIVADVVDGERLAVGEADIHFSAYIPPMLKIRADAEQMYRVISNLVRNARQAIMSTGKPGDIIITASEADDFWVIDVTDTGPGLPAKAQEHLFTAFQGGIRKGGSGLGMAISEELVRGHGGSLELVSTNEKGTVFRIKLPRGDEVLSTNFE